MVSCVLILADITYMYLAYVEALLVFIYTCYILCNSCFLKVLAENYHKAANWSEPVILNLGAVSHPGITKGAISGVAVAAAIIAVVLIILIVLTVIYYWQRRRDKVVFLKVCMPLTLLNKSV